MSIQSARTAILATAAALMLAAAPASAAVVADAFTSFDGTQGAGGFYYGTLSDGFFTASSNCFISGSVCLQTAANHDVPGITKSTAPSFQYGTVDVPTDRLLLHPGADGAPLFAAYLFDRTSTYTIKGSYNVQDRFPTGVGVNFLALTNQGGQIAQLGTISGSNPSGSFETTLRATAGSFAAFAFDNAGNYYNDSTGFNFTISAVPEPSTWAMMIFGMGGVGTSLRRRRQQPGTLATA